jgi:3-methyladenine DNA glycosylase AlkC
LDDSEYEYGDGHALLVHSTQHTLDYTAIESEYSRQIVREAFVASAFHYWEKWARSLTGLHDNAHTYAVISKKMAETYDKSSRLDGLNTLNNLLKHGKPSLSLKLADQWPELFRSFPTTALSSKSMTWQLNITHEIIEESFDVVRKSGPQ